MAELNQRAKVGRPPRLSRAQITEKALELLGDDGLAAFSLRRLAATLPATPMAVQHYFGDRGALLDAIVERIFSELERPDPALVWDAYLAAWARSLLALFTKYPVMFDLVQGAEHINAAWFRMWIRIPEVLHLAGYRGEELLMQAYWWSTQVHGLIRTCVYVPHPAAMAALRIVAEEEECGGLFAQIEPEILSLDRTQFFDWAIEKTLEDLRTNLQAGASEQREPPVPDLLALHRAGFPN